MKKEGAWAGGLPLDKLSTHALRRLQVVLHCLPETCLRQLATWTSCLPVCCSQTRCLAHPQLMPVPCMQQMQHVLCVLCRPPGAAGHLHAAAAQPVRLPIRAASLADQKPPRGAAGGGGACQACWPACLPARPAGLSAGRHFGASQQTISGSRPLPPSALAHRDTQRLYCLSCRAPLCCTSRITTKYTTIQCAIQTIMAAARQSPCAWAARAAAV